MTYSALNIGITGLNAAQIGIATTGQNISNASTPGYSRQEILQQANVPMFTGSGFIGQGVNVETVKRIYSQFLTTQVLATQSGAAAMDSYQAQINQIDNLVTDPNSGLSPALTSFFASVQALAADPASIPARQSLLSTSQSLVSRFQGLDQRFSDVRTGTNSQIANEVSVINSYAQQIGYVNQRILVAQAAGVNQPANDLLDQRDQLINSLNKEIQVSTVPQSDGTYSLFIGNGQPLVIGNQITTLQAAQDTSDPFKLNVALQLPSGAAAVIPDAQLTGGTLGGLISFRNQSLDPAQNALGRIAIGLAQVVNDQHKLGQDLTGALGGNYFNVPTPAVFPDSNNPQPAVAVSVSINSVANLMTSDYQLTSNGGGNYTLLRLSDNKVLVKDAPLPASVDGLVITPAGIPASGSTYVIQPTRTGGRNITMAVTDPRNIAIATPISTSAALTNSGTASIDAGAISSTASLPAAPITLTYDKATNTLSGFPTGSTVSIAGDPASPYTITNLPGPTPVTYTSGAMISFNGMSFTISGTPVDKDAFSVGPNSSGVADNRNALLIGQLQTQNVLDGSATAPPSATFQAAYAEMVSQVGNTTRQVQVDGKAQQSLADQAQTARDSVSGVNLDEEAAKLLTYQQAYQASAKLISIAGKLFDSLLATM